MRYLIGLVLIWGLSVSPLNAAPRKAGLCRNALAAFAICAGLGTGGCYTLGRGHFKEIMESTSESEGERQAARNLYIETTYEEITTRLDEVETKLDLEEFSESNLGYRERELIEARAWMTELQTVLATPLKDEQGLFIQETENFSHEMSTARRVYGLYWHREYRSYRYWSAVLVAPLAYLVPEFLGVMGFSAITGFHFTGPLNLDEEVARLAPYETRLADLEARVQMLKTNATRNPINWRFELRYTILVPSNALQIYQTNFEEALRTNVLPGNVSTEFAEEDASPAYLRQFSGSRYNDLWVELLRVVQTSRTADQRNRGYIVPPELKIISTNPANAVQTAMEISATFNAYVPQEARADILRNLTGRNGVTPTGVEYASNATTRKVLIRATWLGAGAAPADAAAPAASEDLGTAPNAFELELRREIGGNK